MWVAFIWGQTFGIFRHLGLVDPNFATKVENPFFFFSFFKFGKVGEGAIHVEMNFLWYLVRLDLNWIILLFQVYYKVLYNSAIIVWQSCSAKLGNIVPARENFPIQPYNSFFFFFFLPLKLIFLFYFILFGKVGEGGIHVEILGNIVAAGENFPIQHLYL